MENLNRKGSFFRFLMVEIKKLYNYNSINIFRMIKSWQIQWRSIKTIHFVDTYMSLASILL